MKLILTVGISASGKSTWAKEQAQRTGALIACRDDLRFMLTGANGWPEYRFKNPVERLVTRLQEVIVLEGYVGGEDVILADTNLNFKTRKHWFDFCNAGGIDVEIKEFPIDFREAVLRDSKRGNFSVGADVIERQWHQWQQYLLRNKDAAESF